MERLPEQAGPRVHVTLRSTRRDTEVRIQLSWRCRLSSTAAVRLLVGVALVLAAAIATSAHGELARGALYTLAGFLAALRPRVRP
jgi:hypothetical protein